MKRIDPSIRISLVLAKSGEDPAHFQEVKQDLQDLIAAGFDRVVCVLRQGDYVVLAALEPADRIPMITPDQKVISIPVAISAEK